MYLVERRVQDEAGDTYLQIRIHTSCCKRQYLVKVVPDGYYDLEKMQNVPYGAKRSIDMALEFFNKNGSRN